MQHREPFEEKVQMYETEKQSMAAYLVYICQSVSDRKELEPEF